ncbi:TerC family protein, partial [Parageobacillus sp. SY1]
IITIGAGVLEWTVSKMIGDEPFLDQYFANPIVKYGFEILVIAGVIAAGTLKKKKGENKLETKAANE